MTVESHFENHKSVIETELKQTKETVLIAVAWINFKEYFNIFKEVLTNKAKLKIVCSDNWQNRSHQTIIDNLVNFGAEIRLLKMPRETNHMYHKFAIVDSKTILNGSFNWSPNATSSFENIIIIKDFPNEVTKFISEFNKLWDIESKAIKDLQKNTKCQENKCDGELFNILVFSEKTTKYYEVYGDIIEVCTCCNHQKTLQNCILNNRIEFMLNAYQDSSDDYETELIDRDINRLLDSYVKNKITIHAIGRVNSGLRYRDDDFVETNIIWKNKFVGDRLPDKFDDTTFGVVYDN
ncbi:MAG: hypothetical protein FDX21_05790 [Chlorobium sp.]|nr:MAG: hypothetical protein FDX21_05790 [Chlorobium sp.]